MNTRRLALALAAIVLLAISVPAAGGSSPCDFTDGADSCVKVPFAPNTSLLGKLERVKPRILAYAANTTRPITLSLLPADLQARLEQVSVRMLLERANTTRHIGLPPLPPALQSMLNQINDRIVLQYANTSRTLHLAYPAALINDQIPPQIGAVSSIGARAVWTTDEWATSTVEYGLHPGLYLYSVSDPLYAKRHEVALPGLAQGQSCYFRVSSTDRNGNTTVDQAEHALKQSTVSLPMVLSKR